MFTCYKIVNSINNKLYIGVTHLTKEERLLHHFYESRHGTDTVLYRAIRKYGEDKFQTFQLETHDTIEAAWEAEKKYIKEYDTFFRNGKGYNIQLDLPSHGNSGSIEYWTKKIFQIQLLRSNLSIS